MHVKRNVIIKKLCQAWKRIGFYVVAQLRAGGCGLQFLWSRAGLIHAVDGAWLPLHGVRRP